MDRNVNILDLLQQAVGRDHETADMILSSAIRTLERLFPESVIAVIVSQPATDGCLVGTNDAENGVSLARAALETAMENDPKGRLRVSRGDN